jgi:pilus assembly protein Flp/PilA
MPKTPAKTRMFRRSTLSLHLLLLRRRMRANEEGATAIEYALIASGIGAAIAATVWSLGAAVKTNLYDKIAAMF